MENKGPLLTFHYRDTPNDLRQDLVEKARGIIEAFGFNASESQCAIEAKPPVQWNKGRHTYSQHGHKLILIVFNLKVVPRFIF